jgi:hypothetical protein
MQTVVELYLIMVSGKQKMGSISGRLWITVNAGV